jgi:hypothetical protein
MNDERRKKLHLALDRLSEAETLLETAKDEEQDSFDNLSESLQQSERGQKMEEVIAALEEAINEIQAASGHIGDLE